MVVDYIGAPTFSPLAVRPKRAGWCGRHRGRCRDRRPNCERRSKMQRTRTLWLVAALIASTVLTAASVGYADQGPSRGDRMFSRLQRNLGLTDDQVTQIRTIYQQHRDAQRT